MWHLCQYLSSTGDSVVAGGGPQFKFSLGPPKGLGWPGTASNTGFCPLTVRPNFLPVMTVRFIIYVFILVKLIWCRQNLYRRWWRGKFKCWGEKTANTSSRFWLEELYNLNSTILWQQQIASFFSSSMHSQHYADRFPRSWPQMRDNYTT